MNGSDGYPFDHSNPPKTLSQSPLGSSTKDLGSAAFVACPAQACAVGALLAGGGIDAIAPGKMFLLGAQHVLLHDGRIGTWRQLRFLRLGR